MFPKKKKLATVFLHHLHFSQRLFVQFGCQISPIKRTLFFFLGRNRPANVTMLDHELCRVSSIFLPRQPNNHLCAPSYFQLELKMLSTQLYSGDPFAARTCTHVVRPPETFYFSFPNNSCLSSISSSKQLLPLIIDYRPPERSRQRTRQATTQWRRRSPPGR